MVLTFILALAAVLQEPSKPPIESDRPDFTDSPRVVLKGTVQLESGFGHEAAGGGDRSTDFPEATFRIGVTDRFELQVGTPNYNVVRTGGRELQGFDDAYLGTKLSLGAWGHTEFGVLAGAFLPVGRKGIRGEAVAPQVELVGLQELSGGRSLGGMLQVASVEEGGRREAPVEATLSMEIPVRGPLSMFVEGAADAVDGARPLFRLHTGFMLAAGRDAQFDVHFASSVTETRSLLLGAGYSVRF